MKQLFTIEKCSTRKGEYIGYCNGAQRIRKGGKGWQTYALGSSSGEFFPATAKTLEELDAILLSEAIRLQESRLQESLKENSRPSEVAAEK